MHLWSRSITLNFLLVIIDFEAGFEWMVVRDLENICVILMMMTFNNLPF